MCKLKISLNFIPFYIKYVKECNDMEKKTHKYLHRQYNKDEFIDENYK